MTKGKTDQNGFHKTPKGKPGNKQGNATGHIHPKPKK